MKRVKQDRFKTFIMDNGRRVKFHWARFHEEFQKKKIGGQYRYNTDLYRQIVKHIYQLLSRDDVEDRIEVVKKWHKGENGPKDLLEIYKSLAEFFGCEEGAFLIDENNEEDYEVNTVVHTDMSHPNNEIPAFNESGMLERAMKHMREKEAAHELYSVLTDLIAEYVQADQDVWFEHSECSMQELNKWLDHYPRQYPARVAIRKSAVYLPAELRYRANDLLDEMYVWTGGGYAHDWDKLSFGAPLCDGFIENKYEHFDAYLKTRGLSRESLDNTDRDDQWFWFLKEQEEKWYDKLDNIFSDYLRD